MVGQTKRKLGQPPAPSVVVPYRIVCACGGVVEGTRLRQTQVVDCPGCGQPQFVLPVGAWGGPVGAGKKTMAAKPRASRRVAGVAIVAAAVAAAGVLAVFVVLWPHLGRDTTRATSQPQAPVNDARRLLTEGQQALADGNFRRARRALADAAAECSRRPGALTADESHVLGRLDREAALLADLLRISLEEVLQQGLRLRDEEEWQAQFEDYRSRSVVFDDQVRRDPEGRPALVNYVVQADGNPARVALEDLAMWQKVPLEQPVRVLFGARLASCRREAGGAWAFRFQPQSGVLLTDKGAAAACLPAPLGPEVDEVLRRQAGWLRP